MFATLILFLIFEEICLFQVTAIFQGCSNFTIQSFMNVTAGHSSIDPITGISTPLSTQGCDKMGEELFPFVFIRTFHVTFDSCGGSQTPLVLFLANLALY